MWRASCKGTPASALNNATSRSTMWKGKTGDGAAQHEGMRIILKRGSWREEAPITHFGKL